MTGVAPGAGFPHSRVLGSVEHPAEIAVGVAKRAVACGDLGTQHRVALDPPDEKEANIWKPER